MSTLKNSAQRVQDVLKEFNLDFQVVEFSESTRTSQEAADAIGCEIGQIAKTLIFRGKQSLKPVCVIASGKNRVDEKKVAQLVGESIERSDAEFVKQHTGFAIGGVPPVGFAFEIPLLIDQDLMEYLILWAAAGTPNAVFKLTPQDLVRITNGRVVDVRLC